MIRACVVIVVFGSTPLNQHATTNEVEAREHDADPEQTGAPWTTQQADSS